MNKFFLLFTMVFFFTLSSLHAAVYKGQRIFVKKCASCHTSKLSFIKTKTISEWEDLMENKGKPLADLHLKDKEAKKSWEYFNSKRYYKKSKHLEDFLMEYASDSGNVPACN